MTLHKARPKNHLGKDRWEHCRSFFLTIADQSGFPPRDRYHLDFVMNTTGIEVVGNTITVTNGLIKWRTMNGRSEMEAFQSSSGTTFWFDVYNQKLVTSFAFLD